MSSADTEPHHRVLGVDAGGAVGAEPAVGGGAGLVGAGAAEHAAVRVEVEGAQSAGGAPAPSTSEASNCRCARATATCFRTASTTGPPRSISPDGPPAGPHGTGWGPAAPRCDPTAQPARSAAITSAPRPPTARAPGARRVRREACGQVGPFVVGEGPVADDVAEFALPSLRVLGQGAAGAGGEPVDGARCRRLPGTLPGRLLAAAHRELMDLPGLRRPWPGPGTGEHLRTG